MLALLRIWVPALLVVALYRHYHRRLAAFRLAPSSTARYFGSGSAGWSGLDWIDRRRYSAEGQRHWLPAILWWVASMCACFVAFLLTVPLF